MNKKKLRQKIKKFISSTIIYLLLSFVAIRFHEYYKKLKKDNFYTLTAEIKRTDELKSGAFVRLSGIDIGTVSKLQLLPNFSVKVYMKIDNGINIPDDSSVAIYTDGLMGEKYISILPGGSTDYMKNGDEFEFAQDSVNITEMLEIGIKQFQKSQEK